MSQEKWSDKTSYDWEKCITDSNLLFDPHLIKVLREEKEKWMEITEKILHV